MRKDKINDQGFSLVELIIVVAIMAILAVVLMPQYSRHVERARNSADLQNAAEIVTALQMLALDPGNTQTPVSGQITVGNAVNPTPPTGFAQEAFRQAGLLDDNGDLVTRCQSRIRWNNYTVIWTVDPAEGNITFTYESRVDAGNDNGNFASDLAGN